MSWSLIMFHVSGTCMPNEQFFGPPQRRDAVALSATGPSRQNEPELQRQLLPDRPERVANTERQAAGGVDGGRANCPPSS